MIEMKAGAVGTICNGDNVLHGTILTVGVISFDFRIDNLQEAGVNVFRLNDWEFTPDTPPLPTEPGVYEDADGDIWRLMRDGRLVCLNARGAFALDKYAPFTRLVPEVTP